jgi:hypothetical protein
MLSVALLVGFGCFMALSQRRPAPRSSGRQEKFLNPPPRPVPVLEARSIEAQAEERAWQYLDACSQARKRRDRVAAYQHLEGAKEEVRRHLKIDHPVNAEVLNLWGCLRYDEGLDTDARHLWDGARSVASEWPNRCANLIPVIEGNLRLVS